MYVASIRVDLSHRFAVRCATWLPISLLLEFIVRRFVQLVSITPGMTIEISRLDNND